MPVGAGPAVAVELAVTVYRGVVVVALALGEGEQRDQGEAWPSSSVGRHLCDVFGTSYAAAVAAPLRDLLVSYGR